MQKYDSFYPREGKNSGINIRDYIAIEAMKGLLSNTISMRDLKEHAIHQLLSEESYRYADALIAESNKN